MWGEGEGGLDCHRYVQPSDLEWDWIAAGMYSPQSQRCFGFGVDGIAAGTGGEEGGLGSGVDGEAGATASEKAEDFLSLAKKIHHQTRFLSGSWLAVTQYLFANEQPKSSLLLRTRCR
jgi:hypothetical protein